MRLDILKDVAIAVSQERSLPVVLKRIVDGLADSGGIALARVWFLGPPETCECCRRRHVEHGKPLLHLAASAGEPIKSREDWSRLDGEFHHGGIKVAEIQASAKPVLIKRVEADHHWIEKPGWARRERIRSFAGHPLIFRGEQLGVVAVFSRTVLDETKFEWLRLFAIAAAVAIANARASDEIDRLRQRLESENAYLREEVAAASGGTAILGTSAGFYRVFEQVETVAPTEATVLIVGETGVGKELVARAIHEQSRRREGPLIKVNCSAVPRELFESEFFGHVKGAFSGAIKDRRGRFQIADGGTLFLDEVADMPPEMQPKLLRVLESGEFEPVGDDKTRRADVRIIAATNRDLKSAMRAGQFREDLYYRLSVFPIEVPPLRERKEDIPILARYFVENACKRFNRSGLRLTPSQIRQLLDYDWPGNVRELQNVMERAVISARFGSLRFDLLAGKGPMAADIENPETPSHETLEVIREEEMKRRERENIITALKQSRGRIHGAGGAAQLLGVKPTTLSARIKSLGLRRVP
jgi:transcriptional regulator with GAF, ATPase, and Fis domain